MGRIAHSRLGVLFCLYHGKKYGAHETFFIFTGMNGIDFIIQIKISLENSLDSHQGNGKKTMFAVYGNTMKKSFLPNHDEHILYYGNDAHFLGNKLGQINKLT